MAGREAARARRDAHAPFFLHVSIGILYYVYVDAFIIDFEPILFFAGDVIIP